MHEAQHIGYMNNCLDASLPLGFPTANASSASVWLYLPGQCCISSVMIWDMNTTPGDSGILPHELAGFFSPKVFHVQQTCKPRARLIKINGAKQIKHLKVLFGAIKTWINQNKYSNVLVLLWDFLSLHSLIRPVSFLYLLFSELSGTLFPRVSHVDAPPYSSRLHSQASKMNLYSEHGTQFCPC